MYSILEYGAERAVVPFCGPMKRAAATVGATLWFTTGDVAITLYEPDTLRFSDCRLDSSRLDGHYVWVENADILAKVGPDKTTSVCEKVSLNARPLFECCFVVGIAREAAGNDLRMFHEDADDRMFNAFRAMDDIPGKVE